MSKAQHPKAISFVRQKLFSDLFTFEELEQRVAALPDEQSRGDAFEVFAEAYLATQRKHDAMHVWPLNSVPTQTLQALGLAAKDYGIDGVFKTLLGHLNAYQVKFRTNRTPLTWRELSTFMGLADSPQIRSRVLLTNSDELPSVLNERQGFFCIRGSDLDRLEADDFRAIEAWLADAAFVAPKKTPQDHQIEALDALLPALEIHDRVSAIMACGTGKTLIALWVAERRQATKILVLLPSLALLRQVLHEWLRETNLPSLAYLCVCSDQTVTDGLDSIATAQSDLDFQVSTNTTSVRDFLDASFVGTKIIFSTYQSARVVGTAMREGESFDLAVFDEAHKTAGREGRNFGFALEDANIPIRKRLFLTATPRHYNPHQHDSEGDAQLVFSMDRPEVYGPQAFRLTFAEAARRNPPIICGYKVIISVITSEMVTNELLSRGEVLVNGDLVRARQVANQIALRDAIEKYGANKAFTFHRTVASAASFVADGSEGIRTHLPEFETFHVNGTMPTARRERAMRDFRTAARAVMTNARCLTEGVDVPAVDLVAFLSPRRSRVDIVHATGRAMRLSPGTGKTTGYVLVPLYVEQSANESVEAAVTRSSFDEVWDVLHSLQEQDDVLAELIRHMGELKGRGKGFDDGRFADRVDIVGLNIGLEELRSAVTTRCFESLFSSWDTYFGKLVAFQERFGHCNVETLWEEDISLARWVTAQRTRRVKGALTDEQISRLDSLGFVWNWQEQSADENWLRWFQKLQEFKGRFGHCNITKGDCDGDPKLASWAMSQRTRRKKGELSETQIQRMDDIGFVWDFQAQKAQETWMKWCRELEAYAREHGNPHVPRTHTDTKLASWVWIQRIRREKNYGSQPKLTNDQITLLDKLGFRWDVRGEKWAERIEQLKQFREQHGHCDLSEDEELKSWAQMQRSSQAEGKLDPERKSQLDALGFPWTGNLVRKWDEMYDRLKQYHAENGNSDVPDSWKQDPKLARWLGTQRQRRKKSQMTADEILQLDSLGVTWKSRDRGTWEDRFQDLLKFKEINGHCNVTFSYKETAKLGPFVNSMRTQKSKGTLDEDRIQKLESIGFKWAVGEFKNTEIWETRFKELLEYRSRFGSCDVPNEWSENPQLGHWVNHQRGHKRRNEISADRQTKLSEIGFNWSPGKSQEDWSVRYKQLVDYREQFGNCRVPARWPDNPELGAWVSKQRHLLKMGELSSDKCDMLRSIAFV
jgi:superfamily II DNA or RNA helicase